MAHFITALSRCAAGSFLALAACTPSLPRAPTLPARDPGFVQADLSPEGMADDPPQAFQLYPGDVVTLRVISTEIEEHEGLVIDERGILHVPLAGDVPVSGIGLDEAESRIEGALRQFDRTARVSVVIETPDGHRATVIGAVAEPGRIEVTPGMRLADLLAAAGGAARSEQDGIAIAAGDLGGARLVRGGQALPVSLELAVQGDPRHNIRIRPGDQLYVPADLHRLVSVIGQVTSPRVFPHRSGMRLTHALALAGGVTRDGNWGDVRVIRGDPAQPRVYSNSVAAIVDGDAHDVVLAPGDIIYVASAGHADLRDVMTSVSALLSVPLAAGTIAATTVPSYLLLNR